VSKTKSLLAALTADVLQQKLEMFPDIKELLHSKGKERLQALEAAKKKGGASPSDQKVVFVRTMIDARLLNNEQEQRKKELARQPSLKVNHNLFRTPSFRVLNSDDDASIVAPSPFSASWSFSVQPPSGLESSGGFLGIPDDMVL
jgi:hypothetical protein